MSSSWSIYIIVLTAVMIVGSFLLLFGNRTRPADSEAKTGHVFGFAHRAGERLST